MKGLTIWQPWAWLLAWEWKHFETRKRRFNYRGPIAIHAAQFHQLHADLYYDIHMGLVEKGLQEKKYEGSRMWQMSQLEEYQDYGVILATAELVACHPIDKAFIDNLPAGEEPLGDYFPGRYALEFNNMKILPDPIPCKGYQGLWDASGLIV